WEAIPIPMERGATMAEFGGRLYLNTRDSILELEPNTAEIKVLASTRRQPALNPVDTAAPYMAIYPVLSKGICVVAGNLGSKYTPDAGNVIHTYSSVQGVVYVFTPNTEAWEKSPLTATDVDPFRYQFKGKYPKTSPWMHIRYQKDGKLVDPTPSQRSQEYLFTGGPSEISFKCEVPY